MFVGFNGLEDMFASFEVGEHEIKPANEAAVLIAEYENEGYEGSAFVLFIANGKLYEVHGSHCSCYGLEGQWSPEETTVEALLIRPNALDAFRMVAVANARAVLEEDAKARQRAKMDAGVRDITFETELEPV